MGSAGRGPGTIDHNIGLPLQNRSLAAPQELMCMMLDVPSMAVISRPRLSR